MAVTDLTGTKWLFNENITTDSEFTRHITFESNNKVYDKVLIIGKGFPNPTRLEMMFVVLGGSSEVAYSRSQGWSNETYRIIEITGGTDATNSTLISWLQANATQITEQPNTFSFGNLPIANMYFGTRQVKKVYLGNALVWEKEATIIEFNISDTKYPTTTKTYQAQSGMTWAEWVNSQYNTDNYVVGGNSIYAANGVDYMFNVTSSDTIVANTTYTCITASSGSGGAGW